MASISLYDNKYRVFFRKAHSPGYSRYFNTKKDAEEWIRKNEWIYNENPRAFVNKKNIERQNNVQKCDPQSHPDYQDMCNTFKTIIMKYFSSDEMEPEKVTLATQDIYEASLKYKKETI